MKDRQEAKDAKIPLAEPSDRLDRNAREVIGAAIEVHKHLGPGFLESVYEEALAMELSLRGISFVRQPRVEVCYKGRIVGIGRPDFVVGGGLVVEIKALTALGPVHQAQVISYLKSLGTQLGLLLNFREIRMRDGIKRVVGGNPTSYRQQQTNNMEKAREARECFVVTRCNSSVAFEVMKKDLDAVA